ncbi:MAG: hypothetical protein ABIG39_02695 [Candidatus Micrarchaeota archaeon]
MKSAVRTALLTTAVAVLIATPSLRAQEFFRKMAPPDSITLRKEIRTAVVPLIRAGEFGAIISVKTDIKDLELLGFKSLNLLLETGTLSGEGYIAHELSSVMNWPEKVELEIGGLKISDVPLDVKESIKPGKDKISFKFMPELSSVRVDFANGTATFSMDNGPVVETDTVLVTVPFLCKCGTIVEGSLSVSREGSLPSGEKKMGASNSTSTVYGGYLLDLSNSYSMYANESTLNGLLGPNPGGEDRGYTIPDSLTVSFGIGESPSTQPNFRIEPEMYVDKFEETMCGRKFLGIIGAGYFRDHGLAIGLDFEGGTLSIMKPIREPTLLLGES